MLTLCDKILSRNILKPNRRLFNAYTFTCFDDFNEVNEQDWTAAISHHNLFLSYSFLKILDKEKSERLRFRYVIIYKGTHPVGVVYFQINDFPSSILGDLLDKHVNSSVNPIAGIFQKYFQKNENETILRIVTCGNNFISGEHGFYIDVNNKKTLFRLIEGVIDNVARAEKLKGKISAILVKDFYEEGFGKKDCWHCRKFLHFNVEPNMIIDLSLGIASINDYLNTFSKKYRNRALHILKASAPLVKKRLTIEEVMLHKNRIHALYMEVYDHARFKFEPLSANYFLELIQTHGNQFYIDAWFKNEELVSFASGFCLDNQVEAHYIGFDYELNKEFELYQTILYSYIEQAIVSQKQKINLGRTAAEIKSTVGAKAHDLLCYLKPQNTVSKLVLKPFMQFLQPSEWVPRNPFK